MIRLWDYLIYRLAFHSLRRMARRNHGTAVVLKLWINDYLEAHPVSKEQSDLAEIYYEQRMKRKAFP
jgi:hypothetical protein